MKDIIKTKYFQWMVALFLFAVSIMLAYKFISGIDTFFVMAGRLLNIVSPFFYGFLLAYILNIPCNGMQKLMAKSNIGFIKRKRKALSMLITYVLMLALVYLVLRLMLPYLYKSISHFVANFQIYYDRAQEFIQYVNTWNIVNIDISSDKIFEVVREFGISNITESINAAFGVSSAIFKGFLAFVSSIYILLEKDSFKAYLHRLLKALLPEKAYRISVKYSGDLNTNFKQYIYTQTIDGVILGSVATLELYLLGSQYALTLGIMLGIVNYIPYFGSIIGSLIAIFVVALTQGLSMAAVTAVILLVTQQIDGNIIQPKLMGGSFSLSPLLIIISITVGGAFFGVLGMIAAIPIVAVAADMLNDIIMYFEKNKLKSKEEQ